MGNVLLAGIFKARSNFINSCPAHRLRAHLFTSFKVPRHDAYQTSQSIWLQILSRGSSRTIRKQPYLVSVPCSPDKGGTPFADLTNLILFYSSIIGFNGAGKSNFFQAVMVCLADAQYDKLSRQDRIALLHEVRVQQFGKKKKSTM